MALRLLNADDQKARMASLPLFFDFAREDIIKPFEEFVAGTVRPAMFKVGEKFLRRFRILILKAEAFLQRLSDYFHGKRIAIKNGNGNGNGPHAQAGKNSEFWNEMREVKNGPQNGEKNK